MLKKLPLSVRKMILVIADWYCPNKLYPASQPEQQMPIWKHNLMEHLGFHYTVESILTTDQVCEKLVKLLKGN